jgi:hypothetical protein
MHIYRYNLARCRRPRSVIEHVPSKPKMQNFQQQCPSSPWLGFSLQGQPFEKDAKSRF